MRTRIILFPYLLTAYHLLYYFSQHNVLYPQYVIILPLAASVVIVFAMLKLLNVLIGDKAKAGILVSLAAFLFFSYGIIYMGLDMRFDFSLIGPDVSPNYLLFPIWMIVFIAGSYFIIRTKRQLWPLTTPLNISVFLLFLIPVVSILNLHISGKAVYRELAQADKAHLATSAPNDTPVLPDIYYIILDTYLSADTLMEEYGFDNSDFIENLENMGFYVAGKSTSNYTYTFTSLASSLNFKYLHDVEERMGPHSKNIVPLVEMIHNNRVAAILGRYGYRFTTFPPPGPAWPINLTRSDNYWPHGSVSQKFFYNLAFLNAMLDSTMVPPIKSLLKIFTNHESDMLAKILNRMLWKNAHHMLESIPKIPDREGPHFVYAHFFVCHPPFILGRDGEFTHVKVLGLSSMPECTDQMFFLNKRLPEMLGSIISNPSSPSIIIIQSDHGIRSPGHAAKRTVVDKKEFSILNAYYMPGDFKDDLYETITPVNTFRVI